MPAEVQPGTLNVDDAGKRTSSYLGDIGDGTDKWYQWRRTADGGDVAQGDRSDAAVIATDTTPGTVISLLKGLLTRLGTAAGSSGGVAKAEDSSATSGDLGIPALGVQRDTAVADGAAGDYAPFHVDASGRLHVVPLGVIPGYPPGATPLVAESGIVAAGTATATLAGAASVTTYITGFEVTAAGATAGLAVEVTVSNLIGGITASYVFTAPAGVAVPAEPLVVQFPAPIPASAANTSIAVSMPTLGAGNTHAAIVAHGFRI